MQGLVSWGYSRKGDARRVASFSAFLKRPLETSSQPAACSSSKPLPLHQDDEIYNRFHTLPEKVDAGILDPVVQSAVEKRRAPRNTSEQTLFEAVHAIRGILKIDRISTGQGCSTANVNCMSSRR